LSTLELAKQMAISTVENIQNAAEYSVPFATKTVINNGPSAIGTSLSQDSEQEKRSIPAEAA